MVERRQVKTLISRILYALKNSESSFRSKLDRIESSEMTTETVLRLVVDDLNWTITWLAEIHAAAKRLQEGDE